MGFSRLIALPGYLFHLKFFLMNHAIKERERERKEKGNERKRKREEEEEEKEKEKKKEGSALESLL